MKKDIYEDKVLAEYTLVKKAIVFAYLDCLENMERVVLRPTDRVKKDFKVGLFKLYLLAKPHLKTNPKLTKKDKEGIYILDDYISKKGIITLPDKDAMTYLDILGILLQKSGITKITFQKPKAGAAYEY